MKRIALSITVIVVALGYAISHADDDASDWTVNQPLTDWSPVVYPLQRLPITFSHQKHLARGTACVACHPAATTSRSAVDNLIPTEVACRACHAIDRAVPDKAGTPSASCATCHPGFVAGQPVGRIQLTPPPLKFDHSRHAQTACARCHDMTNVDLATTKQLPTMASCLGCHKEGSEERHCTDCHLAKLGGLMETQFVHGDLVPHHDGLGDAHGPDFAKHHAQEARQIGSTCTACHDQSECIACHQGVTKPMDFHPGNYLLTHPVEARRGTPDCSACHRSESFCVACHERAGLGTRGDTQFDSTDPSRLFHPMGWSSKGPGPNRHAIEARKNISSCTSCHREEDCLTCHSADSGNTVHASPHPPGWRGSAKCRAMDRGNRRMCLRCHVTKDELGCDWSK
jgi:hypothetical protein